MLPEQALFMVEKIITGANAALSLSFSKRLQEEDITEAQAVKLEEDYTFNPLKGNVIFACSSSNWAFTLDNFSEIFAQAIGNNAKAEKARQFMWGDFYFDPKEKKIVKKPMTPNHQNIFVSFILKNIYNIFNSIIYEKDKDKLVKICSKLKIELPANVASKLESEPQIVNSVRFYNSVRIECLAASLTNLL